MNCHVCFGIGFIIKPENQCYACGGSGKSNGGSGASMAPMPICMAPMPISQNYCPSTAPIQSVSKMSTTYFKESLGGITVKKIKKCDVCDGLGGIPEAFLELRNDRRGETKISGFLVTCEICEGSGVIMY